MSNLKQPAFPITEGTGMDQNTKYGLTKHEYAAILLAGHLATRYQYLPTIQEGDEIATTAHFLATQVLGKFK